MVVRIRVTRMTLVALVCLLAQILALPLPATPALAVGRGSGGGATAAPTATAPARSSSPSPYHPYPRASLLDSGTPLPTDVPTPTPSAALTVSATASATTTPSTATAGPSDTSTPATAVPSDTATPASPTPSETPTPSSTPSSLTASVLGAPLSFALNEGQTDPSISFLAQGPGYTLFLSPSAATLATVQAPASSRTDLFDPAAPPPPITATVEDVVKFQYSGANPAAPLVGQQPFTGTINYLQGSDPNAWLPGVATYGQVVAQGVYPGIDLVYYGTQGQLETDWRVGAGADPGQIAFTVAGAEGLSVDGQGNLRLATALGTLVQQAPVAYQEIGGQRQPVAAGYTLSGGRVGFSLGSYDPSQPLVIDPVLSYSTYLGGSGLDEPFGIAVDAGGAAYVAGYTASIDYPTTTGAFSTTSTITQATYDAFVTKLTPQGNKLSYSTYLGGSAQSFAHGIAVDAQGDAYVVGYTQANDFPTTTNAYSQTKPYPGNGNYSMFLSKLNPGGSALLYSTYFGADKNDFAYGVALDAAGHAYLVGAETSSGQATSHGHQKTNYGAFAVDNNGATNGYWAVFDPTQSGAASLLYASYIGGTPQSVQGDAGYGIALDGQGNVYLTGGAGSIPTTPISPTGAAAFPYYPYDQNNSNDPAKSKANRCQTINSNSKNVFVAKYLSTAVPSTYTLAYVDYLGGGNNDFGYAVAADAAGNAYVTGRTSGTDFPITNQSETKKGTTDAFVAKVNVGADGCVDPLYATFLGGSQDDEGLGITVDGAGRASVVGETDSITDFPTTPDAVQPSAPGGAEDAFVTTLDPSGQTPTFSTYLGGSGTDAALGLAQDSGGSLYATGVTSSTDFITTTGAYSTSLAGNYDGFVTKLGSLQSGSIPWHAHHSLDLGAGLSLDLDLSDGHVDLHAEGMDLPGRGPDLVVNQTWDSTLAQQGATTGAGTGWVSTLTPAIGGSITGTLLYTDSSGATWPFLYLGSITATLPYTDYQTPAGYPWALTATTSGYSLTNILTSEVLNFDTTGRYVKDVDAYGNATTLSYDSSGPISSTNSGGRAIALANSSGRLTDVKSWDWITSNGTGTGAQQLTYSYNGSGQLTSLTRGAGTSQAVTTTFGYSGTQLTTVTTPLNQSWSLGYDSQGRISYVASPVSGTVGQAGYTPGYLTAVGYTAIQTTLVEGYGAAGQQITIYSLDASGEPVVTTDGLGHSSVAFYDADHDVVYSQDADKHATTTYYQYVGPNGSTGLVTETVQPSIAADVPGNQTLSPVQTLHAYNATNDLTETVSPAGGTMLYGYDGHHSVLTTTQQTNPLPCSTTPCPGQANQWQGTINGYDQFGELTSSTDGRGVSVSSAGVATLNSNPALVAAATRHMTYYTTGDLKSEGTPPITTTLNGQLQVAAPVTTTYAYNADGRLTQQTTPNGATTLTNNDHLGRPQSVQQPPITLYTGSTVTPTESTTYDGDGRVATQTDANSHVTLSSYDPLSRLTAETNAISGTTIYTYNATEQTSVQDPVGNVSTSQYDAAGRLTQQTNPVSGTVQNGYDAVGNTTAITSGDASGNITQTETINYNALDEPTTDTVSGPGQAPVTTLSAYDTDGNVVQVQNPNLDVTYNTYDAAGQLLNTEIDPGLLSSAQAATHPTYDAYSYDPAGNATLHVDADGRTSTTQYDGDSRVLQSVDATSAPTGTTTITTTPSYDPDGNTITQTTQTADSTTPGVVATHTYTNAYNAADWTTSSGDDGKVVSYGYDAAGQQRTQTQYDPTTITTALDPAGRTTGIGEVTNGTGPYTSTFWYNGNDLPLTATLPGGVQQSAQYDPASRLRSLSTTGATGLSPSTYSYGYNALGWTTSATGISGTDTITHDALGRLTAESGPSVLASIPGQTYRWGYDGNGNVITGTDDFGTVYTNTYSTSQPNELVQSYDPDPHSNPTNTQSFRYDGHGDTTAITTSGPVTSSEAISTSITYNAAEQPITLTHKDADYSSKAGAVFDTISAQYNGLGLRSRYSVVVSGTAILDQRFSYRDDGNIGQVVATTATLNTNGSVKSSGTYTDTYVYGPVGEPLEFVRQQNGQTNRYWYVLDGNGSVVAVTDSTGKVVDSYAYDSWGEMLTGLTTQQVPQQLRYDGYWQDDAVGWYWVRIRYYDPELMRWMQPDPTEIDGVHTYVYVGNDPIDSSDPSGRAGLAGGNNPCIIERDDPSWMYFQWKCWQKHGHVIWRTPYHLPVAAGTVIFRRRVVLKNIDTSQFRDLYAQPRPDNARPNKFGRGQYGEYINQEFWQSSEMQYKMIAGHSWTSPSRGGTDAVFRKVEVTPENRNIPRWVVSDGKAGPYSDSYVIRMRDPKWAIETLREEGVPSDIIDQMMTDGFIMVDTHSYYAGPTQDPGSSAEVEVIQNHVQLGISGDLPAVDPIDAVEGAPAPEE